MRYLIIILFFTGIVKGNNIENDSLFKITNDYYNAGDIESYYSICKFIKEKATLTKDSTNIAKAEEYLGDYYQNQSVNDST